MQSQNSMSIHAQDADGKYQLIARAMENLGQGEWNYSNWRYRLVMNQEEIGHGEGGPFDAYLGYIYMINFHPTFNNNTPSVNAKDQPSVTVKHPYHNNTLVCEINFTEYDVGDIVTVNFTWYRNTTKWYNNSYKINNTNIEQILINDSVEWEEWHFDDESINVTSESETYFSLNTTSVGNIEPEDSEHYEVWKCSVRLFDQFAYSDNWVNSTPLMVYNHRPDYNEFMGTYYEWPEDSDYHIDLGTNFSDIDGDDINWYINWTSTTVGYDYVHPDNITIIINNVTGDVHIIPRDNVTGYMYIRFTGVDNNISHTDDWYLRNDYGHTNTSIFKLNITQVNDNPWASDVYIDPQEPHYRSTLTCLYTYNDIENHPENTSKTSYRWYINDEGVSNWVEITGMNSSTLTSDNFDLDDLIKCGVRVKDIYHDWDNVDQSLWQIGYTNSSYVTINLEKDEPKQQDNIIIAVG